MKYEFELDDDSNDFFEETADNVAEIRVFNQDNLEITQTSVVEISLSKNALIGLGTELIRMAYKFKDGKHIHLEPVNSEQQVQRLGIFLKPTSSNTIISCKDSGCIDEYISDNTTE